MSFFERICDGEPDYGPPDRVYAWVDAPSSQTGDGYTRLDCLDADWADRHELSRGLLASGEVGEEAEPHVSMILWREETSEEDEGRIAEMRLGERAAEDEADALHFLNLSGAAIPRTVSELRWPEPDEARRLGSITEIGGEDAEDGEVAEALPWIPQDLDAVAVYDVGQGSCAAVIGGDYPRLYFDLGRGANGDAKIFPADFSGLCTTARPPVVLSHWHVDHWAMAKHFGGHILESTWIVPRQPRIGPASATLLGLIRRYGRALVRRQGAETLRVGSISLHGCTGRTLNDSGIAMVVWGPGERPIALPGDARYRHITDLPHEVVSLVVAHHGGQTRAVAAEIPVPLGDPAGRLVFSCGPRNGYGHPRLDPIREHALAWQPCSWLSTSDRSRSSTPEHIHLYWDQARPDVRPPCRPAACSLSAARR